MPSLPRSCAAALLLVLVSGPALAGSIKDVQALLSPFGSVRQTTRDSAQAELFKRFAKAFQPAGPVGPALDYLAAAGSDKDKEVNAALFSVTPENSAWVKGIRGFKVHAKWEGDAHDTLAYEFHTLFVLVEQMKARLGPAHPAARYRFAQLLQHLLPFYFVHAANLKDALAKLQELNVAAPGLIHLVCAPQVDYAPMERQGHTDHPTGEHDCGRGFELKQDKAGHQWSLVLTYNPHAEVPPARLDQAAAQVAAKYQ